MPRSSSSIEACDIFIPSTPAQEQGGDITKAVAKDNAPDPSLSQPRIPSHDVKPLESCYDLICDNDTFQVEISCSTDMY